jgi:hypothetical protein
MAFIVNRMAIVIDATRITVNALPAYWADDDPKRFRICIHSAHSVVARISALASKCAN